MPVVVYSIHCGFSSLANGRAFMPTIRKIPPPTTPQRRTISELEAILARDPVGLTRCDYPKSHSYGWMARVYNGGTVQTRFFADAIYGGNCGALDAAITWRDEQRAMITPYKRKRSWRLVRVDRPEHKNVGWFAYADKRRYFSDAVYGGSGGAKQAAEEWLKSRLACEQNTTES